MLIYNKRGGVFRDGLMITKSTVRLTNICIENPHPIPANF